MAGSQHGVRLEPEQLIAAARAAGREAAQRSTLYEVIERYPEAAAATAAPAA
jgi:FO synthase